MIVVLSHQVLGWFVTWQKLSGSERINTVIISHFFVFCRLCMSAVYYGKIHYYT